MIQLSSELERDLKREVLTESYYLFFCWAFKLLHPGQKYVPNFHVKYLCDILQNEAERMLRMEEKDQDILVNIPPRTSKSLIFSVCLLPWMWIRNPELKFITVSFDAQLALLNSQLSRDIISSEEYQLLFGYSYFIRPDVDSKGYFANNKGGYRLSRTTGQNVTGFSGAVLLVDDPDSAMSIYSQTERDFVHRYYFEALYNRLTPANFGFRCIVQQRLHPMDLTGAVLQRQPNEYKHICLPAELTNNVLPAELKSQYINGLLDPKRLSLEILQKFKQTLGSSSYTGQYLESPTPGDGGIFKREWFDTVQSTSITRDPDKHPIHFFLDTAYTDKTTNDPTGICTCFAKDNLLYILDVQEVWMEFPQLLEFLKKHIVKFQYHNQNSRIYVEPKASGKSVVQQLKSSTMLNVIELDSPRDSKITRANAISPICESKRIKLIEGNYIKGFMDQLTAFPLGVHDDMSDAFVYAVDKLLPMNSSPDFAFMSF